MDNKSTMMNKANNHTLHQLIEHAMTYGDRH